MADWIEKGNVYSRPESSFECTHWKEQTSFWYIFLLANGNFLSWGYEYLISLKLTIRHVTHQRYMQNANLEIGSPSHAY